MSLCKTSCSVASCYNMNNRSSRRRLAPLLSPLLLLALLNAVQTVNARKRFGVEQRQRRLKAIRQLKELVPPPGRHDLGGEVADDDAYARFLSVAGWEPEKAAPGLSESFEWRKRVQPGALRPRHCPTLCRQHAWVAVTSGPLTEGRGDANYNGLDVPHNCPPLRSWRTTRHGLPITYFRCWMWRPDKASAKELERHMAYHMHHLVRRMGRGVSRICIVFDLRGFEGWMLPYIHQGVKVLRAHYPGRAGAMCFINAPGYFYTLWKVMSQWLDDEIRRKVFFMPKEVNDLEKVIGYVNKMKLESGPV